MALLGVNIDHVATLRQARRESEPDPVLAAIICQQAGADSIVAHLREDRRHIQEKDIRQIKKKITCPFNCEISLNPEVVEIVADVAPDQVTLVPEKRIEVTTEGGLDVVKYALKLKKIIQLFHKKKIKVSAFIDPVAAQIQKTHQLGINIVEFHTGEYARAKNKSQQLSRLIKAAELARKFDITVNAGHGLNYENVKAVAKIDGMNELNIGHSIISHSVFVGLTQAVKEMKRLVARP